MQTLSPGLRDSQMMSRALQLAERGLCTTSPNPRVGCVIVQQDEIVGEGYHRRAGEAHAEVLALQAAGERARGATVYVTLEPCAHTGRTGPCVEALIEAGVARVVYAMEDPNPQVSGKGLQRLLTAGIEVSGPVLEADAQNLNAGFSKRMTVGLPLVRCKLAMSLDGRTAMADGKSKWITTPAAREDVQHLRARSCAIVTGVETVLHDNPLLNVRLPGCERQPLRFVIDSQLRTPPEAEIFSVGEEVVLVHALQNVRDEMQARYKNATLLACARSGDGINSDKNSGKVDLRAFLQKLARDYKVNEVLVEAGAKLCGGFLSAGLVDELIVYMAPKLLGKEARPLFDISINNMEAQLTLSIKDVRAVGGDWRITAIPDPEG